MISRRQALMRTMFGVGGIGLRALATGIPAAFLLNPKRAMADGICADASKAQYFVLSTSGNGDPLNANAPGTYADSKILHSADPMMAAANFQMHGKTYRGAKAWSTLPQDVLDRTTFWHLMTNTPIHPKEPDVLKLMGQTVGHEMLPSLLAKSTAACFNTIQPQPFSVGGAGPSEALAYDGSVMPVIPPVALKDTLTAPAGALANLQHLRDDTMKSIYTMYKTSATPAEKAFIDATANTQDQVRRLDQGLLSLLAGITDNSVASQILATVALLRMNVSPVISLHIPFGGDNHSDTGLMTEAAQTATGIASIGSLISQLQAVPELKDKVSFMTLNVFGRTLMVNGGASAADGRTHNPNHQVSVTIGAPFKGGVIGGVAPVGNDYGATGVDSATGASDPSGDVTAVNTLGSYAKTLLSAVGGDPSGVTTGKVISAALVNS